MLAVFAADVAAVATAAADCVLALVHVDALPADAGCCALTSGVITPGVAAQTSGARQLYMVKGLATVDELLLLLWTHAAQKVQLQFPRIMQWYSVSHHLTV